MTTRNLDFRVSVRSGQLRGLENELQRTVVRMLELGPAGGRSGAQAAAGLQRVERAASSLAQARVRAAVITRRADEAELLALQQLARTQKRGSAAFIETNRLAAQSARQLGHAEIAAGHDAAIGFRSASREVSSLARGGLAASGIFRRFGRTIAFAGAGFLGGFTVVSQIRDVFEATQAQTREEGALQAQLAASGLSWTRYGRRVEAVARAQAEFAAVNETKVQQSLTGLIRTTGDITTAERLNAIALDVSAAKHRDVVQVASVLGKVYDGNVGAARRLGISLGKDVKDPLVALNLIQQQFAGQAEAAANTAGGAYTRFSNALTRDRVAFGEGILPVITRDLNALEKKLQDPATIAAIQRIGEEVSQELEAKLTSAAHFVERNWPEIKRDFHDAGHALEVSATAAGDLAEGLNRIAGIVPGHDSLIRLLIEGALLNKLSRGRLLGKGAPAAASGGLTAERLAGGVGIAGLFSRGRSASVDVRTGSLSRALKLSEGLRGSLLRIGKLGAIGVAVDLIVSKRDRQAVTDKTMGPGSVGEDIKHTFHAPEKGFLGQFLPDSIAYPFGFGKPSRMDDSAQASKRAQREIAAAFKDGISQGTDQGLTHFNERITRVAGQAEAAAAKAAAAASKRFDAAFKTVEDKLLQAFDARTSAILDSFDAQTSKLEEKLSATVRVPSLHETFTVTVNGKTPAERELEALDKLQERRNFRRDIFDAREQLAQAKAGGDPFQIRQAQRALQDAQAERRRSQLETRAAAERKAADAAIAARKGGFERRRAQERRDLEAERNLQREHLQAELEAEKAQIEKGKLTAGQGQRAIVNTMRKFGLNYHQAGIDLGAAFGTGLHQALAAANKAIDRLEQKLAAANRSAAKLAKVSDAGLLALAGRGGRAAAAAVSVALGLPPPAPPLKSEPVAKLQRGERKARDVEALVQLHPPLQRLERALHSLGFDPHVPARLDAAGLRLVGRELPLAHLEKLLAFLRSHPRGLATGGVVEGPSGRDVIPARLTRGEVVFEAGQQRALMRRLGVSGGPNELFRHVQRLTGSPWSSSTRFERFASGGVAGSYYDELLRQFTRRLAELQLAEFRAPQRGRPGHRIDPVQIEKLVGRRLGAKGEQRLGEAGLLRVEQRLAQEQAHPFSEGLLRATPTGTQLGPAARTGRALSDRRVSDVPSRSSSPIKLELTNVINLDGKAIAKSTRTHLLKQSKRGYVPRRPGSPRRGSNLGLQ